MNENVEMVEKENLTPKEFALLTTGVIMGLLGGLIANYLTMFSKERFLENPAMGSVMFWLMISSFSLLLFCLARAAGIQVKWIHGIIFLVAITLISVLFFFQVKSA